MKRALDVAAFLGIPLLDPAAVEANKKRRVDIDSSVKLLTVAPGEIPPLPTAHRRLTLSFQFVQLITETHTMLPIHGSEPQPLPAQHLNPFAHTSEMLKSAGIPIEETGSLSLDKLLVNDGTGDVTASKVMGVLQRLMLMNMIIEVAALRTVQMDAQHPLACCYCHQMGSLLTIADEAKATCKHPLVGDTFPLAIDPETDVHPFASRQDSLLGYRVGKAICVACLYRKHIMCDEQIRTHYGNWFGFEELVLDNIDEVEDAHPLCLCNYNSSGVFCLFRFSFVNMSQPSGLFAVATPPPSIASRAESLGFATLDPSVTDVSMLKRAYDLVQRDGVQDRFEIGQDALDSSTRATTDVTTRLAALQGQVQSLTQLLPQTLELQRSAPLPSGIADAYKIVKDMQPHMQRYHAAMKMLVDEYGDQMVITRDTPTQNPLICGNCGGYGHGSKKRCPLLTDPDLTPRDKQELSTHFAQNIAAALEPMKQAYLTALDLHRWEDQRFLAAMDAFFARSAQSQLPIRGHPSPFYMTSGNPNLTIEDGVISKRKKMPKGQGGGEKAGKVKLSKITPSVPFTALAGLKIKDMKERLAIDLFMRRESLEEIRQAWEEAGFDTSDFADYEAWIKHSEEKHLDRVSVDDAAKIEAFHHFIQARCVPPSFPRPEEVSLPLPVPTAAPVEGEKKSESDSALAPAASSSAEARAPAVPPALEGESTFFSFGDDDFLQGFSLDSTSHH